MCLAEHGKFDISTAAMRLPACGAHHVALLYGKTIKPFIAALPHTLLLSRPKLKTRASLNAALVASKHFKMALSALCVSFQSVT